ncbi:flavodoxin domain-containing protein [Phosphitispora fastidiosa]|uniref:flavodoxin domain-containing protein n=1 Tax=Phosphitispora fastidiosa TaxID=2837202 RepID=UPI001E40CB62|nr:flavodoxin domain-containing protein [Phosphitispora fastidiosa]MBU7006913.1 menaquinone-dependent protoporphyrinogen oxidase [Phosphitispora fastidiosa]
MKTLIIYTTKYGCTEKAASILKSKMTGEVSVANIAREKAPSLEPFDNVILGGSIYVGKIQKALTKYIDNNLPVLLGKRVGLFICAGQPEPVCSKELEDSFPEELFKHAVVKEVFGHEYRLEKVSFIHKMILRKVAGVTESASALSEEKITSFAKVMEYYCTRSDFQIEDCKKISRFVGGLFY